MTLLLESLVNIIVKYMADLEGNSFKQTSVPDFVSACQGNRSFRYGSAPSSANSASCNGIVHLIFV